MRKPPADDASSSPSGQAPPSHSTLGSIGPSLAGDAAPPQPAPTPAPADDPYATRSGIVHDATRAEAPPADDPASTRSQVPGPPPEGGTYELPPPLSLPSDLRRPEVPGYEILGELGRGGMGVVYKARQRALKRLVALKMILAGAHAAPDQLARFRSEAEAVARLQHPNIVQVYEIGEHDGLPFFSLEYVDGGSLAQKSRGSPQPADAAARLIETLARAMQAAHDAGVIHRDLKPANVLLTADGTPKITDFGLAKQLDDDSAQTHSGAIMGSPSYMAPEQAAGRTREIGPRADVYALGAILYDLLTGRPPFKGVTLYDTLDQVRTQEPVPPCRLRPKTPHDLETICLKCLRKEPGKRYASARDLADDLRRFLDEEPIRARPVSWWERTHKWARRRPAQALLALTSALLVAALPVLALLSAYSYRQEAQLAQERERRTREEAEQIQKLTELRQTSDRLWKEGVEAKTAGRLDAAKESLVRALTMLDNAPEAGAGDRRRIQDDLDQVLGQLKDQAGRREWQDHLKRFEDRRRDLLFHEIPFTDSARDADRAAVRRAATDGLAELGLKPADAPADAVGHLEAARPFASPPEDLDRVAGECYQVLLVLAEAEAPAGPARQPDDAAGARRALHLLDVAAAVGAAFHVPTPHAYHVRRARYLTLTGDDAGARAAKAEAGRRTPETALDLFLIALDRYRQGDRVQAAAACEQALRRDPTYYWAQYLQALCLLRGKHWGEAKAGLTACLNREPSFLWPQLLRAVAETYGGEHALAEEDFADVLRQADDRLLRWAALANRGGLRVYQKQWPDAVKDLRAAIGLRPDAPEAYATLAQAYLGLSDADAAVQALDQAVARCPDNAGLYRTRAEAQLKRKDEAAARRDFRQAIAHEPPGGDPERLASDHVELAHLQHRARDYDAALASCAAALKVRPDYPFALLQRAETLLVLQSYREAAGTLDQYLRKNKGSVKVYKLLGMIRAGRRQYVEAVEAFDRALAQEPDAEARTLRGLAFLKLGATRAALADFDAALKENPADREALHGRGHARVCLGQVAAGLAEAEAALKQGEATPRFLVRTACTYAQAVRQVEAASNGRAAYAYRERAADLVRLALEQTEAAKRQEFWRNDVEAEADLLPVRNFGAMAALARTYGR